MCQISAYLNDEKVMENVIFVEPTPGGVVLTEMFEQPREFSATIVRIDLLKNRLFLEDNSREGEENGG